MARHRAPQLGWLWGGFGAALLFLFASGAWASHVAGAGEFVAPGVTFAGADMSGSSAERTESIVTARSRYLMATPVAIDTGAGFLVLRADELGFGYDERAVVDDIRLARYEAGPLTTFFNWVQSGLSEVVIDDQITFDRSKARARLERAPELTLQPPKEPQLTTAGTNFVYLVPGEDGTGVNVTTLLNDLADVDLRLGSPTVYGEPRSLLPTVTDAYADEIAERINELTAGGMEVIVGSTFGTLNTAQLRRHIESDAGNGRLAVTFDTEGLHAELEEEINGPVGTFSKPTLDIIDGDIVIVEPGDPAPVCCEKESVRVAAEGILAGGSGPWLLNARETDDETLTAWATGSMIVDKVGEFTTPHSCCQPRVTNIQRMADIVRGTYLIPGESISLNEKVKRTRANGFVADGAIRQGSLTDEVGGGVSQFATTIFNAAYFAGLDFETYKAHSLYFSRYPFGREATISSPSPDLIISNTTEYPVLIWTSYEPRSITVTMYSTQNVDVIELGQRVSRKGQCTYVETDRLRTYPDGRRIVDTFEATYRPGENLNCSGGLIVPPPPPPEPDPDPDEGEGEEGGGEDGGGEEGGGDGG